MSLIRLWNELLDDLRRSPGGIEARMDLETRFLLERLVGLVDGALESEEDTVDHPLAQILRNRAYQHFARMANASQDVTDISSWEGFERIRKKLGDPNRFEDVLYEIKVAADLAREGMRGSFLREEKRKKTPDIAVSTDIGVVPIEVTHIGPPAVMQKVLDLVDPEFWSGPEFGGVEVDLAIMRFISKPHREEIRAELARFAERVRQTGKPEAYNFPGAVEARLIRSADVTSRKMRINAPPFNRDEVGRLASTIEQEGLQIPEGEVGILVIFDAELMLTDVQFPEYPALVRDMEEYVFNQPKVLAVLVIIPYATGGRVRSQILREMQDYWGSWRKVNPDSSVEDKVLVINRYLGRPVPQAILRAFGYPPAGS